MRIGVLLASALVVSASAAAGPWAQPDGGWYGRGVLAVEDLDDEQGFRADLYGEYGLTDRLTLTAKSEAVVYPDFSELNRETWRLTLRREVWRRNGWSIGVEAGPVYGSAVTGVFGCQDFGGEARISGGLSGVRANREFYVFSDLAYIAHDDGCQRQRAEFGYGADIWGNVFLSQQVWIERGNETADSNKFETQLGYHFSRFDVSIGYREELGDAFDERAALIAVTARR